MRLAVLLALTSTAYAEPKDGGWTFDAAVGGGARLSDANMATDTTRALAVSTGIGYMFVPDVSYEMRFDENVFRNGPSVVGTVAITLGCRFWVSPNMYATLGFGRAVPQNEGILSFENGGVAFAAGIGYAARVQGTDSTKLTIGLGVTHIDDDKAPTTVSALIGVLAL